MRVKYVRYSTDTQTADRQLIDTTKYEKIYQECISGSIAFEKRPVGGLLLKDIRDGKITDLCVEEASRIGRNALNTLEVLKVCEEMGVNVVIENMGIQSLLDGKPNPVFKLISHIFSVMAENERELIRERCKAGMISAKKRGVHLGRKRGTTENDYEFLSKAKNKQILKYLTKADKKYTFNEISAIIGCSTKTIQKVKKISKKMEIV